MKGAIGLIALAGIAGIAYFAMNGSAQTDQTPGGSGGSAAIPTQDFAPSALDNGTASSPGVTINMAAPNIDFSGLTGGNDGTKKGAAAAGGGGGSFTPTAYDSLGQGVSTAFPAAYSQGSAGSSPSKKFQQAQNTVQPATPGGVFTATLTGGSYANPWTGAPVKASQPLAGSAASAPTKKQASSSSSEASFWSGFKY